MDFQCPFQFHTDSEERGTHRPVVVEMTQFVGEPLHVVRFESTRVIDDVEVCWS